MADWQPIETAPSNEWILVKMEKPFDDGLTYLIARKEPWEYGGETGFNWSGPYADFYLCAIDFPLTSWTPLPEPPLVFNFPTSDEISDRMAKMLAGYSPDRLDRLFDAIKAAREASAR